MQLTIYTTQYSEDVQNTEHWVKKYSSLAYGMLPLVVKPVFIWLRLLIYFQLLVQYLPHIKFSIKIGWMNI